LILCFFWCFSKEEERGSREEEGKELILCWSSTEESGRRRRSRVVFLFEANLFSSVGIVPVFVVCGFQGKKISIQEEQTKAKGGFFFFDCDYACAHENAGRQTRSS
jgi:hypothetical protein